MADPAKIAVFDRLQRLRIVQRRLALAALATAQNEDRRLTSLAARSAAIAADYAALKRQITADDLISRTHFSSQMADLARSADAMGNQARAATDAASDNYTRAKRSLENATERLREAQSLAAAKAQQRAASSGASLARRLLTTGEDTATGETGE